MPLVGASCFPMTVDCSSSSPDPLDSRRPAHAGVKEGYLSAVGLSSVKMVADRHRYASTSVSSRSLLGLEAICLGLGPVGLVSCLGPLRLVETFCAGARRAYGSCS